jgi:hypothetical protein
MRFASLNGGSNGANYAAAGKAVANSAANIFNVQRKTGPDYAGLSMQAMKSAAEEKIAGMNAEAKVTQVGLSTVGDVASKKLQIEGYTKSADIKRESRKAGALGAIGKMVGAGYLASRDNTKGREMPKGDRQGILDKFKAANDASQQNYDDASNALGDFKPPASRTIDISTGNDSGKVTSGGASGTSLEPSETGQAYMKMLTDSGMSKKQAAAMVGHLKVESDNFQADTEYAPNAYGTKGRGHLQWTDTSNSGGRRTNFENFANSNNLSPTSFEANSRFLMSELQGNHGNHWTNGASLDGFLQTQSIEDASSYLQSNYIRPGVPHTDRRLQGAYSAFNNFQ